MSHHALYTSQSRLIRLRHSHFHAVRMIDSDIYEASTHADIALMIARSIFNEHECYLSAYVTSVTTLLNFAAVCLQHDRHYLPP